MILLDPLAHPVIGHRGNRAHAPENTIESMAEAVQLGVDALEFDLHVSRDGHLVVVHDPTLDRTTDGVGLVAQRNLAELKTLDAGARFTKDRGASYPWRGRGVRIPTFAETVESLPRDLPLIIELKTSAATEPIRAAVRRHGIAHRVIVAGFDASFVRPLRGEGFALGASTADTAALLWPAVRGQVITDVPYDALCIPPTHRGIPLPIRAMVRATRPSGVVMHLWTINNPGDAQRFWRKGVNGIISDDPALMLAARSGI